MDKGGARGWLLSNGYTRWMWAGWLFWIITVCLPTAAVSTITMDVELNLAVPDDNVTWTRTNVATECELTPGTKT